MPLEYEIYIPESVREGALLIVLLHGRGSDRHDLMGLRPGLPPGAIIVTPQAPFPAAEWGYGPGWAWYRYLGDDRPDPDDFDESHRLLREFLRGIPAELPVTPGILALGGFSQGGTMSLSHALRHPGEIPLVLNFSGFLAKHPEVRVTPETVRGTRIFWGHGRNDPAIPLSMAERGRRALTAAGADLHTHDETIGHWIDPNELAAASAWILDGVASAAARDR